MLVFGFLSPHTTAPIRARHSGLIYNPVNVLRLPSAHHTCNLEPTVLLLPVLSEEQIMTWSGEPYGCLIIAKDKDGMGYSMFSRAAETESNFFREIDSRSPDAQSAFRVFSSYRRMLTSHLAPKDLDTPSASRRIELCQLFREFLRRDPTRAVPTMDPAHWPPQPLVCITFGGARVQTPASAGQGSRAAQDRCCPHPLLLTLRSVNALYNLLHRGRLWPAWSRWLAARPDLEREPLTLLPC